MCTSPTDHNRLEKNEKSCKKKLHKYKTSLWHCFRICNPECTLLNYDEGALWRRLVCRQTQDSISSIFTLILHLFLLSQFYYYSKAIDKDVVLLSNTVWEIKTSTFQTNQLKKFFCNAKIQHCAEGGKQGGLRVVRINLKATLYTFWSLVQPWGTG